MQPIRIKSYADDSDNRDIISLSTMKKSWLPVVSIVTLLLPSLGMGQRSEQVAIAPWTFVDGTKTSRETAIDTVRNIIEGQGWNVLPQEIVDRQFESMKSDLTYRDGQPLAAELIKFGKSVQASKLVYGKISWHTRSIWVGAGPKTISTSTVDVFVFDVNSGKTLFKKSKVEGRSDEKEQTLKVVAAVLVTPLITAVSGGPATPREQRAVQISLGRAFEPFIHANKGKK